MIARESTMFAPGSGSGDSLGTAFAALLADARGNYTWGCFVTAQAALHAMPALRPRAKH
jgi:hypothetical protein